MDYGNCDAVVAGAGIWGCTLARRLAEAGLRVLLLEARPAIGGNVRCRIDEETGIEVHEYGSHIFHTHDDEVWSFVRRFTEFNGYQHKVLAHWQGKTYFLPLGLALINKFFGVELKPAEVEGFMADEKRSAAVFDAFFRGYTSKQWGMPPEKIDPGIIKRVPVRRNYDVNYFRDYRQGIPCDGYNALFERLVDHELITVRCNEAFSLPENGTLPVKVYYSGPLDRLFGYRHGALPWRSLRFEYERVDVGDFQGTSVVNYTDAAVPYTRIHEFKHYHPDGKFGFDSPSSVICREYPADWKIGDEPYYPVNVPESAAVMDLYRAEAAEVKNLVVGGRLGEYRYYDMDQAMAAALAVEI